MTTRQFRRAVAIAAVVLVSLTACGSPEASQAAQPVIPSFVVDTTTGGQINIGDLQGQDAMLWFWAPW